MCYPPNVDMNPLELGCPQCFRTFPETIYICPNCGVRLIPSEFLYLDDEDYMAEQEGCQEVVDEMMR